MAGYTRTDTTNNIADGNIINATDLDNEFDGIQAAFSSSTGHNHDGTTGEGAPILVLGPTQDVVVGASTVTPKTTNTVDIGSSSLKYKDLHMAGNALVGGTLGVTGIATFTAQPVLSSLTASSAVATDASKGLVSVTNTGTGNNVLATSPTLVTPALGTPASGVVTNLTGTASININGTVGATTATTGAFTTLGASSTATLNTLVSSGATLTGGTINGMTVGATTASTGAFTSLTDSGNLAFTGTGNRITGDFSNATINNRVAFQGVSGSTTDVGSIPPSAASAASFIAFNSTDTGNAGFAQLRIDGSEARVASSRTGTGTYVPMVFYTGGSERARIDTSGNVGIGVSSTNGFWGSSSLNARTVISQSSSGTAIDTADKALVLVNSNTTTSNTTSLVLGTVNTGGTGIAQAAVYSINGTRGGAFNTGQLGFACANSSGSLIEAVRIDSSGNVGIGTSSPNTKLEVSNGALMAGTSGQVLLGRVSSSFPTTTTTGYFSLDTNNVDGTNGGLTIKTLASNVLTERARIDSSGNLLVGATSQVSNEKLSVVTGNTTGMVVKTTGGATYVPIYSWNATTTGDGYFAGFFTEASPTLRGSISYNRAGGLVAYNTTSDYRAKDITGLLTNSGALIDSVPVYMGKMKGATQERPMFIAHEVPAYAHTGEKDAVDKDGKPVYQQMDASALVPVMWAEIQSLRARVQALESN